MNFGIKEFRKPTPKIMQSVGNALFTSSVAGAALTIDKSPALATGVVITGMIGKFISQFFSEDEVKPTDHEPR